MDRSTFLRTSSTLSTIYWFGEIYAYEGSRADVMSLTSYSEQRRLVSSQAGHSNGVTRPVSICLLDLLIRSSIPGRNVRQDSPGRFGASVYYYQRPVEMHYITTYNNQAEAHNIFIIVLNSQITTMTCSQYSRLKIEHGEITTIWFGYFSRKRMPNVDKYLPDALRI